MSWPSRAYLNGRLDLAQAEAVADLIDAGSSAGARAALRSLSGEFSSQVERFQQRLTELRTQVEAGIDFPDEDIELVAIKRLEAVAAVLSHDFLEFVRAAERGRLLHDGLVVVIAGRPNAGKSSLLNRLSGQDAAIVSHLPGTTRDVLRERVVLDGLPVEFLDTAGLRNNPGPIEAEGMRRAEAEMTRADHVLYLVDSTDTEAKAALDLELSRLPDAPPVTVIYSKADLAAPPTVRPVRAVEALSLSALTGEGIDRLRMHLVANAGLGEQAEGTFSARARQVTALARAGERVTNSAALLAARKGTELVAEELRLAQETLSAVTGSHTSDDLLGEIFGTFCIGK